MKKSTWRKHHKWFGLIMAVFIILFCVSGIILNHRQLFLITRSAGDGCPKFTDTITGTMDCCGEHAPALPVCVGKTVPCCCMAMPAFF